MQELLVPKSMPTMPVYAGRLATPVAVRVTCTSRWRGSLVTSSSRARVGSGRWGLAVTTRSTSLPCLSSRGGRPGSCSSQTSPRSSIVTCSTSRAPPPTLVRRTTLARLRPMATLPKSRWVALISRRGSSRTVTNRGRCTAGALSSSSSSTSSNTPRGAGTPPGNCNCTARSPPGSRDPAPPLTSSRPWRVLTRRTKAGPPSRWRTTTGNGALCPSNSSVFSSARIRWGLGPQAICTRSAGAPSQRTAISARQRFRAGARKLKGMRRGGLPGARSTCVSSRVNSGGATTSALTGREPAFTRERTPSSSSCTALG